MTWAKQQIETFVDLFKRQVDASNISQSTVDECLHVTATQNRKVGNLSVLSYTAKSFGETD